MTDPWAFQRWAFETRTGSVSRKAVLVALAVMADANTGRCEAKVATICQQSELKDRAVRTHLGGLVEAGIIERRPQHRVDGSRRGDEFLLRAPWVTEWPDGTPLQDVPDGADPSPSDDKTPSPSDGEGVSPSDAAQEQPLEEQPPMNNRLVARDDLPSSMSYRGKKVPKAIVETASRSVRYFAGKTGQTLRTVDGMGKASTSLTRVVGAMLAHPELADPEFAKRTIDFGLAAPWWKDEGPPGVGVIFGPNVVERMIEQAKRDAPPSPRAPGGRQSASDLLRKLDG